jgi:hypothetical protein
MTPYNEHERRGVDVTRSVYGAKPTRIHAGDGSVDIDGRKRLMAIPRSKQVSNPAAAHPIPALTFRTAAVRI